MDTSRDFLGTFFKTSSLIDRTFLRLMAVHPEIEKGLSRVAREAARWESLPNGWTEKSVESFWDSLTGEVKHKVTKCISQMDDKVDDAGAFCAALADRVDPGWRSRRAAASFPKQVEDTIVYLLEDRFAKTVYTPKSIIVRSEQQSRLPGRAYKFTVVVKDISIQPEKMPGTFPTGFLIRDEDLAPILSAITDRAKPKDAIITLLNEVIRRLKIKKTTAGVSGKPSDPILQGRRNLIFDLYLTDGISLPGEKMAARVVARWEQRMAAAVPRALIEKHWGLVQAYIDSWAFQSKPMFNAYWAEVLKKNDIPHPDAAFKQDSPQVESMAYGLRSLQYKDPDWMSVQEFSDLFAAIVPSYNAFSPKRVSTFLKTIPGIQIQGAREYSVALYIKGKPEALAQIEAAAKKIRADEADIQSDGMLRLWWD